MERSETRAVHDMLRDYKAALAVGLTDSEDVCVDAAGRGNLPEDIFLTLIGSLICFYKQEEGTTLFGEALWSEEEFWEKIREKVRSLEDQLDVTH